jgi:putative SOS response-associated peptidase YedK
MCGRYASFLPAEANARLFGTTNPLPNLAPSWNVAPTNDAAVVRYHRETGVRHLDLLKWGLLPYWTKEPTRAQRPINARSASDRQEYWVEAKMRVVAGLFGKDQSDQPNPTSQMVSS